MVGFGCARIASVAGRFLKFEGLRIERVFFLIGGKGFHADCQRGREGFKGLF